MEVSGQLHAPAALDTGMQDKIMIEESLITTPEIWQISSN
jgi:hypothetical protein